MSKEFEEARLVITADIVFDPDLLGEMFYKEMLSDIKNVLKDYKMLNKNVKVELESFICEHK